MKKGKRIMSIALAGALSFPVMGSAQTYDSTSFAPDSASSINSYFYCYR